jgi:hypothetical protein
VPATIWNDLLGWAVCAVVAGFFIASAVGVLSMTPPQHGLAEVLFTVGSLMILCRSGWWLAFETTGNASIWQTAIASSVIFGVTGLAYVAAIRWVEGLRPRPITASGPYPWITSNIWFPDSNGNIDAVRLHLQVRDYPGVKNDKALSLSHLENIHVRISVPVTVNPDLESWWSCTVADKRSLQWNNDNFSFEPLAKINLTNEVTVIEVSVTANNGRWLGFSVLRKNGKTVDSQSYIGGHFSDKERMSILEEHKNGSLSIQNDANLKLDKTMLISFGVPARVLQPGELPQICSQMGVH